MAFEWEDKQNGVDDVLAEDINSIANEVVRIVTEDIKNINEYINTRDSEIAAGAKQYTDLKILTVNSKLDTKADQEYVNNALGDIDTTLDIIVEFQNELIGGASE